MGEKTNHDKRKSMEWKIIIHESPRYLEVITSGIADKDSSLEMAKAISENMRKNRITRALVDHRQIEAVEGKIVDIYDRPKIFWLIGVILSIRIAEVIKPEHVRHFSFFETVCLNHGYKFSIFQERGPAERWLFE
jgi:hypothetical protein